MHVYLISAPASAQIVDFTDGATQDAPSFLEDKDEITGFAYDPFTDHFFLRLAAGNRIRVVDRPARAIKREFPIEGLASLGSGDLAVRPRDGHLFLLHDSGRTIVETTRLGKLVRTFSLSSVAAAQALAHDAARDQLLVLHTDGRRITSHDLTGRQLSELTLEHPAGASLGFDAEKKEFYAVSADGAASFLVFDEDGRLKRTTPMAHGAKFVDVGPRSLVRVF
jgi:uncharacterized protein YjiK